jgi:hypothetical protein
MVIPPEIDPAGAKTDAGWSSQVAREAHNLEVAGSNPVPAISVVARSLSNSLTPAVPGFFMRELRSCSISLSKG